MSKRRFVTAVATLLVAAMAIAGCSSGTKKTEQPSGTQTAAPAPAKPKILTVVQGTDIQSLDIHRVNDSPTFTVLEHVNETLFQINAKGEMQNLLAESYQVSPDGLTVTIKIKSGIKFTDGTPFNAAAVKKNIERILDPNTKSNYAYLMSDIKQVTPKDETTVEIKLSKPNAPLQATFAHAFSAMISPAAIDKGLDAMATSTVGTGMFTVKEWKKGESVTIVRNDAYWGKKANLDQITFKMVKEDGARMLELESGTADVAVRVPPSDMARLSSNPNITLDNTSSLRVIFFMFNQTKPPFNDVRVRQAINYAVDKEAIVKSVLNGMGRIMDSPIAPGVWGYAPQTPYAYNKEKAKQLLKEAGYEKGLKFELLHPTGRYAQDARIAEAIRAQLKEIGVEAELKIMEWAQYIPHTAKPAAENTTQMAMLGWSTGTSDADYGLYSMFHTSAFPPSGFNRGFYSNPQVDKLLEDARAEVNPEKRKQLYNQAQKILMDEVAWLFLHSESMVTGIRKGVTDFLVMPSERMQAHTADKK